MVQADILPRVLPDSHFDTLEEAWEEVDQRKVSSSANGAITRIAESPYGGYIVYSVSAEAFVRALSEPINPLAAEFLRRSRETPYD